MGCSYWKSRPKFNKNSGLRIMTLYEITTFSKILLHRCCKVEGGYQNPRLKVFLNNHLDIVMLYHEHTPGLYRVVGFEVKPRSVKSITFTNGRVSYFSSRCYSSLNSSALCHWIIGVHRSWQGDELLRAERRGPEDPMDVQRLLGTERGGVLHSEVFV